MSAPDSKKHSSERRTFFRAAFVVLLFILLGVVGFAGYQLVQRITGKASNGVFEQKATSSDEHPSDALQRALDGVMVSSTAEVTPPLVAVMIDNHPDARPQTGVARAPLVYEFPVEGVYSRYLVVFPLDVTSTLPIGPVRSARPYFLAIAQELGALYAHVGGSPEALDLIKSRGIYDVNEYYKGELFWRARDRFAPHNVLTTTENLSEGRKKYFPSVAKSVVDNWEWSDTVPDYVSVTSTALLTVDWPGSENRVQWKYDAGTHAYTRYRGGHMQTDFDKLMVTANTIIVQHVQSKVLDDYGRLGIDMVGSGPCEVYRDGVRMSGTWKKESFEKRTQWLDQQGNAIPLHPGKIWVQVVDDTVPVHAGE